MESGEKEKGEGGWNDREGNISSTCYFHLKRLLLWGTAFFIFFGRVD